MKLIIDTETWLVRAAFAAAIDHEIEDQRWAHVTDLAAAKDGFLAEVEALQQTAPDHTPVHTLSDRTNFRYGVFPDYKANRKLQRKPPGYSVLRDWLEAEFDVRRLPNVEADDVCGLLYEPGDVIASRDKDLRTIPGTHLINGELLEVGEWEANCSLYMQVLTGDQADGYPGLKGVGPKTAAKILSGCMTEAEMWRAVAEAYMKAGLAPSLPLQMARCARILRPGEYDYENGVPHLWNPPVA